MKARNLILLSLLSFVLILCTPDKIEPINHAIGWFPENPTNIINLNTEHDDYNSNINIIGKRIHLYYSTNKETQGNNFDISSRCIDAFLNLDSDVFQFSVSNAKARYAFKLLPIVNTEFDEYGPFSFYSDTVVNASTWWYFMFANNENGNFDIRFAYTNNGDWGVYDAQQQIYGPFEIVALNSESDDFYPTISSDHKKMYFSSNREGICNLYEIDIVNEDIVDWFRSGTNKPTNHTILSSSNDDKCPYIKGNLMVFASNNISGYGGYDLWYSTFENGAWGSPQNFGSEINTEYDEYRPAIEYFTESNNDLMIFSSNRPEGKGGFDLYYTGISKMIKK